MQKLFSSKVLVNPMAHFNFFARHILKGFSKFNLFQLRLVFGLFFLLCSFVAPSFHCCVFKRSQLYSWKEWEVITFKVQREISDLSLGGLKQT